MTITTRERTSGVARFTARGASPLLDRVVRFYSLGPNATYTIDIEGHPSLSHRDTNPELIIRAFANIRESTSKYYGATAVS